jgi:hypothetical protein
LPGNLQRARRVGRVLNHTATVVEKYELEEKTQ